MRTAAITVLLLAAAYLLILGVVALTDRSRAFRFLSSFAQSVRANIIEMACRLAVGLALLRLATELPAPSVARVVGIVLIVSALVLLAMPTVHRRFADRVVPAIRGAMPLIGATAVLLGIGLVALVLPLIGRVAAPY